MISLRAAAVVLASLVPSAVPTATAQSPGAGQIVGEVQLSAKLAKRVKPGGTLFVYVRPANQDSGPPIAVVSIRQPSYPQRFTLRPDDQMVSGAAPQPLNGLYKLYARHSASGEPMAKEGFLGTTVGPGGKGVKAGASVTVVIDKPLQ